MLKKNLVKPKWSVAELKRFDRILLQISMYDPENNEYEVIGTITLDDRDIESIEIWLRAIEWMNREFSQKNL